MADPEDKKSDRHLPKKGRQGATSDPTRGPQIDASIAAEAAEIAKKRIIAAEKAKAKMKRTSQYGVLPKKETWEQDNKIESPPPTEHYTKPSISPQSRSAPNVLTKNVTAPSQYQTLPILPIKPENTQDNEIGETSQYQLLSKIPNVNPSDQYAKLSLSELKEDPAPEIAKSQYDKPRSKAQSAPNKSQYATGIGVNVNASEPYGKLTLKARSEPLQFKSNTLEMFFVVKPPSGRSDFAVHGSFDEYKNDKELRAKCERVVKRSLPGTNFELGSKDEDLNNRLRLFLKDAIVKEGKTNDLQIDGKNPRASTPPPLPPRKPK